MIKIIHTEPGYTLSAELRGRQLHLTVETSKGKNTWTAEPRIGELPPAYRTRLPAGWRGFWAGYPVREGARAAVATALEARDVAIRAEMDREAKALEKACPGIEELRAALADYERYHEDFERMMEDENNDGACPPRPACGDIGVLREQYPRAAAYLQMEGWSYGVHDVRAAVGRRGMERLLAGEDAEQVLLNSDQEWSGWCAAHVD